MTNACSRPTDARAAGRSWSTRRHQRRDQITEGIAVAEHRPHVGVTVDPPESMQESHDGDLRVFRYCPATGGRTSIAMFIQKPAEPSTAVNVDSAFSS